MRSMLVSSRIALVGLIMMGLGATASAQTVTGTIYGRVADSGRLALPGVTITVASPQLIGGEQTRVTNEAGEFRFPAMPPGRYTVDFEMPGFQNVKREGIVIEAGANIAVDAVLQIAGLEETLTVVGESPMVDLRSAQNRETASSAVIENVPTGRTFVDIFQLMPGVVSGGYDVATTGTNSVHGGSVRNNVFTIDGVNVNDPLVAYPGTDLNLDTVEEVQVTTAGMSAEFGSASGAVFNVITKSGGNNLTGLFSGYFRNESLQSDNITSDLQAQGIRIGTKLTEAFDASGSLGGPLVRDRLWYFGNYQKLGETRRVINYPPPVEADQDAYFLKGTSQLTPGNRLEGLYQYRLRYDFPFIPNVNEQDPLVWRQHRQSNHTSSLRWTSTLSDSTFLEARASIANQQRITDFPNASDTDLGYRDTSSGLTFGGWYRELARPGHRNSRQVKVDTTHFATNWGPGAHDVKFGASYEWLINSEYREWLGGARLHLLFNGQPDRIQLSNAPVDQKGNVDQWALYIQDQWSVSSRVTVNLGVRLESLEGWFPDGSAGGVNFPRETFAEQRDVIGFTKLAPRLGVVYDATGNRSTVLKASFGRYYNQVYTSEFSAALPFAFGSKIFRWNDLNGDLVYQPGEEGALLSDSTVPALGSIDPGVRQSYTDSFTVGIEREIRPDLAVSATYIRKREHDIAETVNAALPFDNAYHAVSLSNPLTGAPVTIYPLRTEFRGIPTVRLYTNPGSSSCSFCPALERRYDGLELSVNRRLRDRWQFLGSYVFSRSEGSKGQGHSESQGNVFGNPNNLVNVFGRLSHDRPHQAKLHGSYELPAGFLMSASYTAMSGAPWARSIRFVRADSPLMVVESQVIVQGEPIGAQRFDTVHELNLRGEKRFRLANRTRIGLILDVFNVMNSSTVTGLQQTRIDHPNFGKAGEIVLPRTLRLGARITF